MKPRWIVAESQSHAESVAWENQTQFYDLDEARCEMHERAARLDRPITVVAVFRNTQKAISGNRWIYRIDRRDRSGWPRWEHCCDCGAYFWSSDGHACRRQHAPA